ncbi:hypothetical protein [Thermus antranikianii]|uniref:Transcriptional regulator n=1 Tax=Thermus antranikianii TaxID=88190 RepID=A0ABY7RMJ7_9DEIN|nr:hypothetical protein [Thermus antranikianii]QWK22629.1 MAG: hypothetical protein KNN15_03960 [Thermus antranikianii]WCM38714.1 hypothetical protein GO600_00530 [Thermus antranikianii]
MRDRRLEAHLLALLREAKTLEDLHAQLQSLRPGLRKATLFALLVRLRREGKVVFRQGRFVAGKAEDSNV